MPGFSLKTMVLCYVGVLIFVVNMVVWKYVKRLQMVDPAMVSFRPEEGEEDVNPANSDEKTGV